MKNKNECICTCDICTNGQCKKCSLGQITNALFEEGGQYRRNM